MEGPIGKKDGRPGLLLAETKNFDNISHNSHPTGVFKPVYGYPTFPLTFFTLTIQYVKYVIMSL